VVKQTRGKKRVQHWGSSSDYYYYYYHYYYYYYSCHSLTAPISCSYLSPIIIHSVGDATNHPRYYYYYYYYY